MENKVIQIVQMTEKLGNARYAECKVIVEKLERKVIQNTCLSQKTGDIGRYRMYSCHNDERGNQNITSHQGVIENQNNMKQNLFVNKSCHNKKKTND